MFFQLKVKNISYTLYNCPDICISNCPAPNMQKDVGKIKFIKKKKKNYLEKYFKNFKIFVKKKIIRCTLTYT